MSKTNEESKMNEERKENKQHFKVGDLNLYALIKPTILQEGEFVYRAAFSKGLRGGMLTLVEAQAFIKERGLWTDEDQNKMDELRDKIDSQEKKLADDKISVKRGKKVADNLSEIRAELINLNRKQMDIVSNSAENYADEQRNQFLVSECIFDADTDNRYFKSKEDYISQGNTEVATESTLRILKMFYGIDDIPELTYAENRWLVEKGFIDKDLNPIDQEKKEVKDKKGKKEVPPVIDPQ